MRDEEQGSSAIAVDTSIPALYVTRLLDQVEADRGLPKGIRTDNGPEFAARTMQTWAARNGVELRFIQPGKPVQNAYIESFNSRFRDECLSQRWFASLSHMRSVIDNWREDYNRHRPHSTLGYVVQAVGHRLACRAVQFRGEFHAGGPGADDRDLELLRMQRRRLSMCADARVDEAGVKASRISRRLEFHRVLAHAGCAEVVALAADCDDQRVVAEARRGVTSRPRRRGRWPPEPHSVRGRSA